MVRCPYFPRCGHHAASYDTWRRKAESIEKETQRRHRVPVHRVVIDPHALASWCQAAGRNVDAKARAEFAALRLDKIASN